MKLSAGATRHHEIKLKSVSEPQYLRFREQLSSLNGVLYAVATDAGLNEPCAIMKHQRQQAINIVAHRDRLYYAAARQDLERLSKRLASLAPQLYVQLHCQVNLIDTVVRSGVLYFAQRLPRHLGRFRWRIDQKNSTSTEYENAFVALTPAFLQSISLREPMPMLEGADYSAFNRFNYSLDNQPTFLRDTYGIDIGTDGATNINMLVRENLKFVDSTNSEGVQVADLLAAGLRRCLRGGFLDNPAAAVALGRLMVSSRRGKPPFPLLGFMRSGIVLPDNVTHLLSLMEKNSRAMLVR